MLFPCKLGINKYTQEFGFIDPFYTYFIYFYVKVSTSFVSGCENHIMSFNTFKDNLLQYNHFWIFDKSLLIVTHIDSASLPDINRLVSSADNTDQKAFDTTATSLTYNKNNSGPSIDPCGTPQVVYSLVDFMAL